MDKQPASYATYPMPAVVMQQPLSGQLAGPRQLRNWSSGVCSCFDDMPSCCCTYWCHFCYLSCVVAPKLGENCCTPYCLLQGAQLPHVAMRAKLRGAHGIAGSLIDDCCISLFCLPCVTCQMKRELDYIENLTGRPPFPA